MIFKEIFSNKSNELEAEFDLLFKEILDNQTHEADLLLVHVNGHFWKEALDWDNDVVQNPYMFGPNKEGHSAYWHYKFIDNYRNTAISSIDYPTYLNEVKWKEENNEIIKSLIENETTSIQLEMLIYLKIWEADLFIKKLYQYINLSLGKSFDWHFKISESNRKTADSTGKRDYILRILIRDKLKIKYPKIYNAFKNAYKTQIRNAIAHSQYYFISRHIHFNNHIPTDPAAQITVLSFDEWIEIFHDTMVIYDQTLRFGMLINNLYSKIAYDNEMKVEVRVNKKYPSVKTEYSFVRYDSSRDVWY